MQSNNHLQNHLNNNLTQSNTPPPLTFKKAMMLVLGLMVSYFGIQLLSFLLVSFWADDLGLMVAISTLITAVAMMVLTKYMANRWRVCLGIMPPPKKMISVRAGGADTVFCADPHQTSSQTEPPNLTKQNWAKTGLAVWAKALLLLVLFWAVSEGLGQYFDQSPMVFIDELLTPKAFWWLMIVMVVVAPIYEEMMFRGLIFGLLAYKQQTADCLCATTTNRQKAVIFASIASSGLFAMVHLQYDWFGLLLIFVFALLLSWARWASQSLILPIVLHLLNNAMAITSYLLGA